MLLKEIFNDSKLSQILVSEFKKNFMKKLIFVFSVLLLISASKKSYSQSDRWVYIGTDNEYTYYIDSKSIVNSNSMYDVWCKKIWNEHDIVTTVHYQFYCGMRKAHFISSTTIYPSGKRTHDYEPLYNIYIEPETPIEYFYLYFCNN